MNANNIVNDEEAKVRCKLGMGSECCSFLVVSGTGGFMCAKGTDMVGLIHHRRSLGTMTAQGDNCSGPPKFKSNE